MFLARRTNLYLFSLVNKHVDEFKFNDNSNCQDRLWSQDIKTNIRDLLIDYELFLISCTETMN